MRALQCDHQDCISKKNRHLHFSRLPPCWLVLLKNDFKAGWLKFVRFLKNKMAGNYLKCVVDWNMLLPVSIWASEHNFCKYISIIILLNILPYFLLTLQCGAQITIYLSRFLREGSAQQEGADIEQWGSQIEVTPLFTIASSLKPNCKQFLLFLTTQKSVSVLLEQVDWKDIWAHILKRHQTGESMSKRCQGSAGVVMVW